MPSGRAVAAWTAGALPVLLLLTAWTSGAPSSGRSLTAPNRRVVIVGVEGLTFETLQAENNATVAALVRRGAMAAVSPRTAARRPGAADFWATISAGDDAEAGEEAALALPASAPFEGMTAGQALRLRGGGPVPPGAVVALGGPSTIERNRGHHHSSLPGALGDALHAAGLHSGALDGAALAVMDSRSEVDAADAHLPGVIASPSLAAATPAALVLIIGLPAPGSAPQLLPVIAWGAGVVPGVLRSPSTNRTGVITLPDLTATALATLGAKATPGMIGRPVTERTGTWPISRFVRMRDEARFADRAYQGFTTGFVVALAALCLLAGLALGPVPRLGRVAASLAAALAAVPGATYLLHFFWLHAPAGVLLAVVPGVVVGGLVIVRPALARSAVLVALAATLALLIVDVLTGGHLQASTALGNSLVSGARFSGLGNATMGLLGGAAVIVACELPDRRLAAPLLALVATVCVVPWLGAKVGAVVTLVPVFALVAWTLSGRRITWAAVGGAVVLTAAVFGLVTLLDFLRPARARSHLARLASASSSAGGSTLIDTLHRKLDTALRVMRGSHWTWAAVVVVVFVGWIFVWEDRGAVAAPSGSPERITVVGVLALAILAVLTNDAGMVAAGLALSCLACWLVVHVVATEPEVDVSEARVALHRAASSSGRAEDF